MKALCIDGVKLGDIAVNTGQIADKSFVIFEGETYTVTEQSMYFGSLAYRLSERPDAWYKASRFLPLSRVNHRKGNISSMTITKERD
jgi:hypothetical protein